MCVGCLQAVTGHSSCRAERDGSNSSPSHDNWISISHEHIWPLEIARLAVSTFFQLHSLRMYNDR